MESLRKRFFDKYNIDAVELLEGVHLSQPSLINSKTVYLVDRIENYLDEKGFGSEVVNDQFLIDFIEALTEANVFLPSNEKLVFDLFQVDVPFKVYKTKNSKGVLEDFKPFVGNDNLRPAMKGVYVGDGELVGTNAHILVILKTKEYQEYKGKIIDLEVFLKSKGKSIVFIDEKYPNYEAVIPKKENQKIIKDVNIIPLLNYLTGVLALKKNIYNKLFRVVINFDDDTTIAFSYDFIYDTLKFINEKGYEVVDIAYEAPNRAVTIYYPKGLALVMPMLITSYENEMGAKTISLNDISENYSSENQEVITKKTEKKINEKKGVVAEWEDTIATLQDLLKEEGVSESDREEWEMTIATLEELLKEQKMELGGLVMSYSSPQIVEGIGSFTSQFDDGGKVDEDNLSYAEASKRWNKKAGLPEEGFQGEAIKIVKENPELLTMLEDGGRIYNDDQLELRFDYGGEVKEERSFKDGYEALKRMGIFDDQPKKKTNREKIEEAKNKLKAKN